MKKLAMKRMTRVRRGGTIDRSVEDRYLAELCRLGML
jgi:hypothetical protein